MAHWLTVRTLPKLVGSTPEFVGFFAGKAQKLWDGLRWVTLVSGVDIQQCTCGRAICVVWTAGVAPKGNWSH